MVEVVMRSDRICSLHMYFFQCANFWISLLLRGRRDADVTAYADPSTRLIHASRELQSLEVLDQSFQVDIMRSSPKCRTLFSILRATSLGICNTSHGRAARSIRQ